MKLIKLILIVLIALIVSAICYACGGEIDPEKDEIISLVGETPEDYEEITLNENGRGEEDGAYIYSAYSSGEKIVYFVSGGQGYVGEVDMVILVTDGVITKIVGYDIKETKDKGDLAFKDSYLNQFYGLALADYPEGLQGGRKPGDGVDILYVTGATYTSETVLNAVNQIMLYER